MLDFASYIGLFFSALLAATILPMQSEAVLAALLMAGALPAYALIAVATLGNVGGSVLNWWLGRHLADALVKRPPRVLSVQAHRMEQATAWYQRYGRWSLLLSWAPIIGDALTVAAGYMREPLLRFVVIVLIAKLSRYLVLAWLVAISVDASRAVSV
jgi:membrane protein YqaA with SNARE-associated domain